VDGVMTLTTPPAKQRDVAEALADPDRIARAKDDHNRALRRLATAAQVACDGGATMGEILAVVQRAVEEHVTTSVQAANARARVHDGDDTF
jgi:hypothetical protein